MDSQQNKSFTEILKRLLGVYVILHIMPNDCIGGIIKSVEDNGKVKFGMNWDMTTNTKFIQRVVIPNEDDDRCTESPLSIAFRRARIRMNGYYR